MERVVGSIIGWFIGTIVGLVVALWRAVAMRVTSYLSARQPVIDPHIERLTRWRSAIGFALVIAANFVWNADPDRLLVAWNDALDGAVLVPVQIALAVVVSGAVLVGVVRRGQRVRMLRAVWVPIKVVGACVLACALMGGALSAWLWLMPQTYRLGDWQAVAVPAMLVANLALLLVVTAAMLHGSLAIVRDRFRARDAHPAMGALVIAALSVWTLGIGITEVAGRGFGETAFPLWASLCLLILGPIVNLGLSAYELVRLHRRFGVTMRAVEDA